MTENNEKVEVKDVVEVEVKDNGLALVYYNDEYYNELAETVIEGFTKGIKNSLDKKKKDMEDFVSTILPDCKDDPFFNMILKDIV